MQTCYSIRMLSCSWIKKKVILKTNNIIVRYILWTTKNSSSFENIFTELLEKLNLKIAMLG